MKRNCKQPRAALDSLNAFVASSSHEISEDFPLSFMQFHSCMHSMYLIRTFIIVYTFNFLLNSIIVPINSFAYKKLAQLRVKFQTILWNIWKPFEEKMFFVSVSLQIFWKLA